MTMIEKRELMMDLSEYGVDGHIVFAKPTFRKLNEMKNQSASYIKFEMKRSGSTDATIASGDLEIMNLLTYVKSAPFRMDVEGFLTFMDRVDEVGGDTEMLYAAMNDMADAVCKEVRSPFVASPAAGTAISE